jgi:hypothetical protein
MQFLQVGSRLLDLFDRKFPDLMALSPSNRR